MEERNESQSPKRYITSVNYKLPKPYEDENLNVRQRVQLKIKEISDQFSNPYALTQLDTEMPTNMYSNVGISS